MLEKTLVAKYDSSALPLVHQARQCKPGNLYTRENRLFSLVAKISQPPCWKQCLIIQKGLVPFNFLSNTDNKQSG